MKCPGNYVRGRNVCTCFPCETKIRSCSCRGEGFVYTEDGQEVTCTRCVIRAKDKRIEELEKENVRLRQLARDLRPEHTCDARTFQEAPCSGCTWERCREDALRETGT